MTRIIDTKNIGSYTLSLYDDGAMTIQALQMPGLLTFDAGQAQELARWLTQQKTSSIDVPASPAIAEPHGESSEEIAHRVIDGAIAMTREHHPASLEIENRDRFIDQITRDPDIKPLVAQGAISRKQIMLWIEQRLGGAAPSLWNQDKNKKRGR